MTAVIPQRGVDPLGRPVEVAATVATDASPAFTADQVRALTAYYREHGYVVVRGVVAPERCDRANRAFDAEVKHDPRAFYRLSGRPEPHHYTGAGFMLHGLRDVQSLDRRHHPAFRAAALGVVTDRTLAGIVGAVLGRPGTVVQTMYFEGNPATEPHQDTHYLDAEDLGTMVAAWIAAEDIAPGAGRFYVCPGSHRAELPLNRAGFNVVEHEPAYRAAVRDAMASSAVVAPALGAGDVLLWSSRTIHGSLPTFEPNRSRRSFTAHFIPGGSRFVQWHRRVVPLDLTSVDGIAVHHPKDLNRWRHRARYHAEQRFPDATANAKRVAARYLFRR
jgi:phytanoyl-CoA hydroxylase